MTIQRRRILNQISQHYVPEKKLLEENEMGKFMWNSLDRKILHTIVVGKFGKPKRRR
jgi:hypothetical protein